MRGAALVVTMVAFVGSGCVSGNGGTEETVRIYSSVTQDTIDAVLAGLQEANPDLTVELFRAATGEVAARIAAEQREGGLQADVLWLTDPLSIQQYDRDGILGEWAPAGSDNVPPEYRTTTFFGTRILNLVIVASSELAVPPADWDDLTTIDGVVAIPDPAFAGSAFGALGFFAMAPEFGMKYYSDLRENDAVQVSAPGDVVTGVAEGLYAAGITLDRTAQDAVDAGSPLTMVWPASGAIAIYSPIAVVDGGNEEGARTFVDFVLSAQAQSAIASTGWQPIRGDVGWPDRGLQRTVPWEEAFDRQDELLDGYGAIFGG